MVDKKDVKSIDFKNPKNGANKLIKIAYPGKWEAKYSAGRDWGKEAIKDGL